MAHKSQWRIKLDAAHSESVQISLKLSAAGINSLSIVFIFTLNSCEEGNPGMQSSQHRVNSDASCNCLQYYMLHVFNIILINDLTIGWQNLNPLSHTNGNISTTSKAKWWNSELLPELLVWYPGKIIDDDEYFSEHWKMKFSRFVVIFARISWFHTTCLQSIYLGHNILLSILFQYEALFMRNAALSV